MGTALYIDQIGTTIKPAVAIVHSIPHFWDYLDLITPKCLRNANGVTDTFLGYPIEEDPRCPFDNVWFKDSHGNVIAGIYIVPAHPP